MADTNQHSAQFGQNFQSQFRPPLPNQGAPPHSSAPSGSGQGPPKPGMPPPSGPVRQYPGPPSNSYMNTGAPPRFPGQGGPPPRFSGGPPPMAGGNVNGFVPPTSQQGQRPPAGMPPPPSPMGNFRPPVSGQFVPPSSNSGGFDGAPPPLSGPRPAVNGSHSTPPPISGAGQAPNRFYLPPPMSQGGTVPPGPPQGMARPPMSLSQSVPPPVSSSMTGQPRMMVTPPSAGGGAPPTPMNTGMPDSGSGMPSALSEASKGPISLPNELPIPFHGQAQYSHQVGATMKLTPVPTPSNSEPPSQRSSRGPSPVNEQSYDALEGQFTPGSGASTPVQPPSGTPNAFPGPTSQGARPPFPSSQVGGPGMPPSSSAPSSMPMGPRMPPPPASIAQPGMRMPPPPRPGVPGQPPPPGPGQMGAGVPPPPGSTAGMAPPQPQMMGRTSYPQMPPYSSAGPVQPQPGPPSGPFNLGPPSSMPSQGGPYYQPPSSGTAPPPGPPTGPPGPPSGPTGPPSGPAGAYRQPGPGYPQPGPGYSQPGPGYTQGAPGAGQNAINNMAGDFSRMGVTDTQRPINLMQEKKLIPAEGLETPRPNLFHDHKRVNCSPDVFRCTLNAIPQTSALLNKARLPLGILIHPFKDLSPDEESQLPVIQSSVIVRCRSCRTYINPFVTFVDQRRWKCNLCFRVNELPEEFSFDPVSKSYGDPQRRPEIRSATIEFIAPSEYMLRPPQPAVYLFLLDVSHNAVETGYLRLFTQILTEELERLPGDARTQIGFLCYDRSLYFFNLAEGLSQPQMLVCPDLEDVFLPCPDNLLVNLHESKDMVTELLTQLPGLFEDNKETGSALGTALQAAFKLMTSTGGRVTVMQTTLPTVGQGALENRETGSQASSTSAANLGPSTDFYKKLALDCSAQQIAVDVFFLNGQYADIATVSCIAKYSAGSVQYYPSFHTAKNPGMTDKFEADLHRYLTRKIGFESVMRIRCTRGLSIHTFHGNFFVRSTDLLSLPNVSPDAGFGMQMSIEDNLTESSNVCFQAALLYTSSKGERRIRVHTLCVPITNQLDVVVASADQQAIASLLAKMAVDRTISSSLEDARDAMMNACLDMLGAYASQVPASQRVGALLAPSSLRLVPLFTLAMLKSDAFRLSSSVRLDERVFAHILAKTMPTGALMQTYYPHLYPVHSLSDENAIQRGKDTVPTAPLLQLSSANIDRHGVYLMDQGEHMYMLVGGAVSDAFCRDVFDVPNFMSIPEGITDLPELENPTSERLRSFVNYLMDSRTGGVTFMVLREDSKMRHLFFKHMLEDRTESSMSYYEFLQFLQQKVKG